jgi:tetratricopeptide (TPR) repeat protein
LSRRWATGRGWLGVREPRETHHSLGDFSQAIKYHTQDLEIAREVGDRAGEEGRAYANLGNTHESMGNFSQAIEYHTRVTATLTIISKDHTSSWPTFLFFRVDFLFCIRDFRVRCSLTQPLFLGAYLYASYIYVL